MSRVTNAILNLGLPDENLIDEVNKFFPEGCGFVGADDPKLPTKWYGGTKMLETCILIGSFNYLDTEALIAHLRQIPFEAPWSVQLMIQEQEEDWFRCIDLFPGEQQQLIEENS